MYDIYVSVLKRFESQAKSRTNLVYYCDSYDDDDEEVNHDDDDDDDNDHHQHRLHANHI